MISDKILSIDGWMSPKELSAIQYFASLVPPMGIIVELGVWMGRSSAAIYEASKDKIVVSIDSWQGQEDLRETAHRLAQEIDLKQKFINNMNSLGHIVKPFTKDSLNNAGFYYLTGDAEELAECFPNDSINMYFDDCDHRRVKETLDRWYPKLKHMAIVSGHDYSSGFHKVVDDVNNLFCNVIFNESVWMQYNTNSSFKKGKYL